MALWTAETRTAFRSQHMAVMPQQQPNHNYPHADLQEFVNLIYRADHNEYEGLVVVAQKDQNEIITPIARVPASQLGTWLSQMHVSADKDYYISKAQMKRPEGNWLKENAFAYNAVWVDIDCHNNIATPEIENRLIGAVCGPVVEDYNIEVPNIIVRSGRGLHLIWLVEQVSAQLGFMLTSVTKHFGETIERYLREQQYDGYRVDLSYCSNISGLTRIPGTYNTAARKYATYEVLHANRMDLQRAYDSCMARPNKQTPSHKNSIQKQKGKTGQVGYNRVHSLLRLLELRGTIGHGMRDIFLLVLFCAAQMAGMDDDAAEQLCLDTNHRFQEPRDDRRVISALSSAEKMRYKYKTDTMIKLLGITEKEQKLIGLCSTKNVARNRNKARDRRTQQKRNKKYRKILAMHLLGNGASEIASKADVCRSSVYNIVGKELKNLIKYFKRSELIRLRKRWVKRILASFYRKESTIIPSVSCVHGQPRKAVERGCPKIEDSNIVSCL